MSLVFFLAEIWGDSGDLLRISAQVISGIGFLGAGMVILKNRMWKWNNAHFER